MGKIRREIRNKRAEIQEAELNKRAIELESRVIDAFTIVYINREKIKLLEEIYNFIKSKHEESEKLSEVEKLLTAEDLLKILQDLEDARIEGEKAELILKKLLGREVPAETEFQCPKELKINDDMTEDKLIQISLKKKAEIIENDKELEFALLLKDLAKADWWPLIIADAGVKVDFEENQANVFAGLDIELPVLGMEKKQIEAAEKKIARIRENREILEKNTKLEVIETYKLYKFTKKRIEDYEQKHLPRIEKLISTIREKYEKNEISFMDFLKAEKSRIEIQNNYFDALFDFECAFSNLEKAVGISLAKGMRSPSIPEAGISGVPAPGSPFSPVEFQE